MKRRSCLRSMTSMLPRQRRQSDRACSEGHAEPSPGWVQRLLPGFDRAEAVRLKVQATKEHVRLDAEPPKPAPKTRAVASVWAMAAKAAAAVVSEAIEEAIDSGRSLACAAKPYAEARVDLAGGRRVITGMAYPSNRWTAEREEQERIRRAKQRPPKPSKQRFKLKNSKTWDDGHKQ